MARKVSAAGRECKVNKEFLARKEKSGLVALWVRRVAKDPLACKARRAIWVQWGRAAERASKEKWVQEDCRVRKGKKAILVRKVKPVLWVRAAELARQAV